MLTAQSSPALRAKTVVTQWTWAQKRSIWRQKRIPVRLRVDHPDYGRAGELIRVKPGFMRQILHPQGWALYARQGSKPSSKRAAEDETLPTSLLRLGLPAALMATVMARRRQQTESLFQSEVPPSTIRSPEAPPYVPALRAALATFTDLQSTDGPQLVFRINAHDGILFGSVREAAIAEALAARLNNLDMTDIIFTASMVDIKSWSLVGGSDHGAVDPGRSIKRVGTYQVSVAPSGDTEGGTSATSILVLVTAAADHVAV